MAGQAVRLSEELIAEVRREAATMSRSIAGQVEHWLRIGRIAEKSPGFSYERVRAALQAEYAYDDLSAEEQEAYLVEQGELMENPAAVMGGFFDDMRARHEADGVDTKNLGD